MKKSILIIIISMDLLLFPSSPASASANYLKPGADKKMSKCHKGKFLSGDQAQSNKTNNNKFHGMTIA